MWAVCDVMWHWYYIMYIHLANQITELADLDHTHLPCLRSLDIHSNHLTSVAGIQLPSLQELYLATNKLSVWGVGRQCVCVCDLLPSLYSQLPWMVLEYWGSWPHSMPGIIKLHLWRGCPLAWLLCNTSILGRHTFLVNHYIIITSSIDLTMWQILQRLLNYVHFPFFVVWC